MQKYFDNHKVKGLVIGLVLAVILFIAGQRNGFEGLRSSTQIQFGVVFVGALASAYLFAYSAPRKYTLGNIFAHSFKSIGVAIIIVIACIIIDHFVFHPNIKLEALADFQKQLDLIPATDMDDAQKLNKLNTYKNNYLVTGRISPTLLLYAVIGALGGLIGASFSPKKD